MDVLENVLPVNEIECATSKVRYCIRIGDSNDSNGHITTQSGEDILHEIRVNKIEINDGYGFYFFRNGTQEMNEAVRQSSPVVENSHLGKP